jgi:hypothetical protein
MKKFIILGAKADELVSLGDTQQLMNLKFVICTFILHNHEILL